jgi:hypothetical protein
LLSLPLSNAFKETYRTLHKKYDFSRYGIRKTTALWADSDINFVVIEDKLYFKSFIMKFRNKSQIDTNLLKEYLKEDAIRHWVINDSGLDIFKEFSSDDIMLASWVNETVKIILNSTIIDGHEVFDELHFEVCSGKIMDSKRVQTRYKTFASCIVE